MTSSAKFAVPFRITLKTSFLLNGGLLFMYLGAYYWLLAFDLNLFITLAAIAAITAGFAFHLRQYLFRNSRRAIVKMVWQELDRWQLENALGETIDARLMGSSFVSPWAIVLNFTPAEGGRMLPLVLMPDSVDSTTYRRLSAKLRVYGGEAVSEG